MNHLPQAMQGGKWKCGRCGEQGGVLTGSYFDMSVICPRCEDIEKAQPKFIEAYQVENEAVRNGDYDYLGIGVPEGLPELCRQAKAEADAERRTTQDLLITN